MFAPNAKPYNGWPVTFNQSDNFLITDGFELPELILNKANQVVTVKNQYTKEVISSIRIKGNTYQPKVMQSNMYTVEVGEGNSKKYLFDLEAFKKNNKIIKVHL